MHALKPRTGQSASKTIYPSNTPIQRAGRGARINRPQIFEPRHNGVNGRLGSGGGEGYQKLRSRLISRGIPESVVDELLDQPTIVSYKRGAFIFFDGAPTDLVFWVSSGLVDILCPGADGDQISAGVLGPGEFFGFIERIDDKGRPAQAFQARARTNVQVGLLIRERIFKVLGRQDPMLLLHILEEVVAAWSELTLHYTQFLGTNYNSRLEIILAELATKFGVKESRGTLLIPEFGHSDFAEMIGCSRPMVSRLLGEMISTGSLAQDGRHYIIIDDSALKNEKQATS
jgi:CRP/FNR family cyclic AMP-dependent transcriptional regulator